MSQKHDLSCLSVEELESELARRRAAQDTATDLTAIEDAIEEDAETFKRLKREWQPLGQRQAKPSRAPNVAAKRVYVSLQSSGSYRRAQAS